jgi:acyl-CoA synthetase (AMP-forming)/AMP-acid ligase II
VDEEFNRLPPGELGELAMYGPFVAEGYLDPSDSDDDFDSGWHYTGDMGVIDEDGFIELKGRKGDMIIRGGENVYPVDVEDVLRENEAVLEAAVTSFPDDVLGERILAVVVPNEGEYLTEDTLRVICERALADYKVPEIFRIVDELPRNANGKIQRDELVPEPLQFGIGSGG